MIELKNIKKLREQLYADVWSEPMTAVAKKYHLSDNGVRKRCKSLNVPIPPFGYWAKRKAGKKVTDRPPLPPYSEIILDDINPENNNIDGRPIKKSTPSIQSNFIELRNLEALSIEEISSLHGLDLTVPASRKPFHEWLDSITVPGRIVNYDNLISNHKLEIEYRDTRDKEYPFRDDNIKFWTPQEKIKDRKNKPVLPIDVSPTQISRAYRIANTLINAFRMLKSQISVQGIEDDNICIELLCSKVSFEITELKSKRRHLASDPQEFRPIYEEIYNGNLRITWQVYRYGGYYYNSRHSDQNKPPEFCQSYSDSKKNPLEDQISLMILEVYTQCCDNTLKHTTESMKQRQQYEKQEKERLAQEEAKRTHEINEQRRIKTETLINYALEQSNNWFKRERLIRYADELEKQLSSYSDDETLCLLQSYIQLLREHAEKLNPIDDILNKMRTM